MTRAVLVYLVLAIALTWPLTRHLNTHIPHDLGDPLLVAYLLNWNATVLPLTERWWNPPFFWPARDVMTLSDHLLGISVIATPMRWMGVGSLAAYNLIFIGSYWTAGIGGWVLGRVLTGSSLAAFVGGLAFMFAPYRAAHLPHMQLLIACGWPLTFAALHRALSHGGKWAVIAAGCWLWQGLASGYWLVFLPVGILIWLIWFAPRTPTLWIKFVTAAGLGTLFVLPVFLRYMRVHEGIGYQRSYGEVVGWSADVASLWQASRWLTLWGGTLPEGAGEEQLFPGIATVLLAGLALSAVRRADHSSLAARAFLAIAVILGAAAAILPLGTSHQLLGLAWVSLIVSALCTNTVRKSWRARSPAVGYALLAIAAWILALGPEPTLFGTPIWYAAPYWWLFDWVPGFTELRVPARFWMLALVAFSAFAALGTARVLQTKSRTSALVLVTTLSIALVVEGWTVPFPLVEGPASVPIPSNAAAVFEVPAGDPIRDATAMYRSLTHGRPVVNGWSGYVPPAYDRLVSSLEAGDVSVLTALAAVGPLGLVIDPVAPAPERYLRMATELGAACSAHHDRLVCLIHATRQASPTPATY